MTLDLYIKLIFLAGLSFTAFGFITYMKNRQGLTAHLFGLLALSFAVWSFSWFMMLLADGERGTALFWARLLNLGAIFVPIFYLHWVLRLLKIERQHTSILVIGYTIATLFILISFSMFYIKGVHTYLLFPNWPTPGPLYVLFLIFGYIGMFGYGIGSIAKKFPSLSQESKYRMTYVFLGSLLGFGGGATNFFGMYGITTFQPYLIFAGAFSIIASPFFLAYAVFRYRLMDVKLIATEFFTGILFLILLVNLLLAESFRDVLINSITLILTAIFGYLIIRSTLNEVKNREEIEKLAGKLQLANKELERVNQAKSDFLSIASHQLKTPLSIIKGYISMAMEGMFGKINSELGRHLDKVYISNERLISLVEDLLNLSRIEDGRMKYDLEIIDMREIITSVAEEMREVAIKKKLAFHYKNPDDIFSVRVDVSKIRNVVFNLVDNAIKYTDDGSISMELAREHNHIRFSVKDTGQGIHKKNLENLFNKFTRAEDSPGNRTTRVAGFGLGLYVTRLIAEAHNGNVRAESDGEGKGSAFILELPLMASLENSAQSATVKKPKEYISTH